MRNSSKFLFLLALVFVSSDMFAQKPKKIKINTKGWEPGIYANFITDRGTIVVKLEEEKVPMTVANFVGLAEGKFQPFDTIKFESPFYNGLKFHRVIANFMIQGGDPLGNGTGGPGYSFPDEQSGKKLVRGSLAMANAGPNTNGSQFFIVTADSTPWLDGKHTNFGEVSEGLDIVLKIGNTKTGTGDRPVENILISKVEIITE
jgi:cyclophilin family peptidyl-prolyl cis-trans isomerase